MTLNKKDKSIKEKDKVKTKDKEKKKNSGLVNLKYRY